MPQPTLPAELFRPIVDSGYLSGADLCAVALASRLLRDEGQRALFKGPGTITAAKSEHGAIKRDHGFFDAIISSPHRLALMVHTYTLSICWADFNCHPYDYSAVPRRYEGDILTKSLQALKLMVNLIAFHTYSLSAGYYFPGPLIDCLRQCTFQLKLFDWFHQGEELRLLEEFLVFQTDIISLEFQAGFSKAEFSRVLTAGQRACPKMEAFCGPMSTSRAFLPGKRNVKFISWTGAAHSTEILDETRSHILNVCDTLQYLEYNTRYSIGPPFSAIAPYLVNLVVLRMPNTRMKEVSELPYGLPTLRAIYFFDEDVWMNPIPGPHDLVLDYTFVCSIFTSCDKLQFIDVDRYLGQARFTAPNHPEDVRPLVSKHFVISPETGKVVSTIVKRGTNDWWSDRYLLVTELGADT